MIEIVAAGPADAGELLTLQRAAYVTEGQLYGDPRLRPLVETLDEVRTALEAVMALKALAGHRIVGGVRAREDGDTLHIGRLCVAPDMQGRGIGTGLLTAAEALGAGRVRRFALFTGHLSSANIRLYERLGYRQTGRVDSAPGLALVHFEKAA